MDTLPNISGLTGVASEERFSISNNYRFDAMIRAIDFFSQKFDLETLIDFSGDFINEILTLGHSAVFLYDQKEDCFFAKKIRLYNTDLQRIPNSSKLQRIATFSGSIFTKDIDKLFPVEFIDAYKPALLIPLIHANQLIGFIVTSGKAIGELTEDDFSMAKAIMYLFNNAFERNYYLGKLNAKEKDPSDGIFETVNKASKVLFSEVNLDKLLSVGTEIFSEISGSMNTAFGVLDEETRSIKVMAYTDVLKSAQCPVGFNMELVENPEYEEGKFVYLLESELDLLGKIFVNPEKFNDFNAKYVVLILKDKILGFVTLSRFEKSGRGYSDEIIQLVNSLAISCFIALSNAMLFEEITYQKQEMEVKYNSLMKRLRK